MSVRLIMFAGLLLALLAGSGTALAERRVALVIGNSAYAHVPKLANPGNDAADMAAKLTDLGFEVVRGIDLDLAGMRKAAREFTAKLDNADMALFFYAGHGLQVDGVNYMAPIDASLRNYDDLDYEVLAMELILSAMERKTKTNLIFLDACRDNPLADNLARSMGTRSSSVGRGLARLGAGVGTLISLATQPGNIALDGEGRNSPFTTALLKHLGTPGQDISRDLILVRREVLSATGGKQVPWDHSSLTGEVVLKDAPKPILAPEPAKPDNSAEVSYWETIKGSDDRSYFDAYLEQFPKGIFAGLARLKIAEFERQATAEAKAAEDVRKAEAERIAKAELEAKEAAAKAEAERKAREEAESELAKAKAQAERLAKEAAARAETERLAREKAEREAAEKLAAKAKAEQDAREAKAQAERLAKEAAARAEADRLAKAEAEKMAADEAKEIEVASLPTAEEEVADPAELARAVQTELNRVGCSVGKIDGKWGSGSAKALRDFAVRQGVKLASSDPTEEVLNRLKATKARACPLVCGKGMEERGGRCERVKREAKVEPPVNRNKLQDKSFDQDATGLTLKSTNAQDRRCWKCKSETTNEEEVICTNDPNRIIGLNSWKGCRTL